MRNDSALPVYLLWFNFILGLNFISLCFWVWKCTIVRLKQREIGFKPRMKLNTTFLWRPIGTWLGGVMNF